MWRLNLLWNLRATLVPTVMTKRKRIQEETELLTSTKSTDQRVLQNDTHLPKRRKNGRKRGSSKGTRLGYETSTEASPDVPTVEEVDPIFPGHSKSSHIVSSPLPIRKALLKWYATVCTDRGMPWRKPHDVNLDMKERAQRAYEVSDLLDAIFTDIKTCPGMGEVSRVLSFWCQSSCWTSDWNPIKSEVMLQVSCVVNVHSAYLSEVVVQQTQVATVIPYYNAWMKKSGAQSPVIFYSQHVI